MARPSRSFLVAVYLAVTTAAAVGLALVQEAAHEKPNYDQIEDGLWLGGLVPKPPPGTTAVLNLCETEDPYHAATHVWRPIGDAAPAPDLAWLAGRVDEIGTWRREGKQVYVHCRNGVSRSGMVVAAYLMATRHLTRDEALALLRTRRPDVRPNPAFLPLLAEWERARR